MNSETVADRMRRTLSKDFAPILLEIEDISAEHAGHAASRPSGETHFRVKIISAAFTGSPPVARHRAVYQALATYMQEGGIHALSLDLSAPTYLAPIDHC